MNDLEEIYKDNYEIVYKYLIVLTHDKDISEELTQETFYRAIKNINKFKGKSKFSTWLCQIAKNLWIDEIKKIDKFKSIEENDIVVNNDEIFATDDKIRLFKEIQKLDVNTRNVIYLRLSGELSFREIAIIMNRTENWARVTFYRGKEKLKEVGLNERK